MAYRFFSASCLLVVALFIFGGSIAVAQDAATRETTRKPPASKVPPGRTTYMGRRIAQTMHFSGAEWLIRENRENEERCSLMLANLGIKPGMTICDMGCGNGFYALQMAKMTGRKGQVLAVDIQPQMLYLLRQRMEKEGVENVMPILGSLHNPRLPLGKVDLILLVDVYHEFSHPQQMLKHMRNSLAEGGLMVLVEYREEDPEVPIKPLHKMSKKQILREMTANGFKLAKQFDRLPWQHMMFFAKDERVESKVESRKVESQESRAEPTKTEGCFLFMVHVAIGRSLRG